jgi:hypothetical protein
VAMSGDWSAATSGTIDWSTRGWWTWTGRRRCRIGREDWSVAMSGTTGGDVSMEDWSVHPRVARRWRTGRRRCRGGTVGGTGLAAIPGDRSRRRRGPVEDWSGPPAGMDTLADWSARCRGPVVTVCASGPWRRRRGSPRDRSVWTLASWSAAMSGGLVVTGRWRCRGDWSAATSGSDWSVHPWVAT